MKIGTYRIEYQFKIKEQGKKARLIWAINGMAACREVEKRLINVGYIQPYYFRIGKNNMILKMIKKHKWGTKIKIVYAIKLSYCRKYCKN